MNTRFVLRIPSIESNLLIPISIDDAIEAHTAWKQKLISYLAIPDGTLDPDFISRDDKCALGKWIYLSEKAFELSPVFQELKSRHREFHKCTAELVKKINSGEDIVGDVIIGSNSKYVAISTEVVESLNALRKIVNHK